MIFPSNKLFSQELVCSYDLRYNQSEKSGRDEGLILSYSLIAPNEVKMKEKEIGTHDYFLSEPIIDFSNKCFENENTHQQAPQTTSTSHNNRNTSCHLNIPLPLISSMNSINSTLIITPLTYVQIRNVLGPKSTYGNRFASASTPLNCEFTFSDSPVGCE